MGSVDLVNSLFDKKYQLEAAVLCSFGLDLNFLENYLLKLNGLYSCDSITIFVDSSTYDEFLDAGYTPRWLNKRYLVTPLRTQGVFHPKLYLLASPKKAFLGIGSANLTRDGITSNLELLSVFEVSERKQEFAPLLRDCISYLQRLAQITQSEYAADQVETVNHLCRPFIGEVGKSDIHLLHNLDTGLLASILDHVGRHHIHKIEIVSPFYDSKLQPLRELREELPGCKFDFYLQQKKSNFPCEQFDALGQPASVKVYDGIPRYLHGKAMLLHGEDATFLFKGSANFTDHALLRPASTGNYEIGLVGPVDPDIGEQLLQPAGFRAMPIASLSDIEADPGREFMPRTRQYVDYLIEAVYDNGRIQVSVSPTIPPDSFQPQEYRLIDFAGNRFEGPVDSGLSIPVNAKTRKAVQGKLAVQLIGHDDQGNVVRSNIVWVIELDEGAGDRRQRRLRRVYADPSELFAVLAEIVGEGNERELMLFLQSFDIPLDLLLPPRIARMTRNVKSKGNVVGTLPVHQNEFFTSNVLAAYEHCLERLLGKMQRHAEHLQPDKVSNFVLIFSSFLVLLDFVNAWARDKFQEQRIISGDEWLTVRDCYDMLLKYSTAAWKLVWAKDGYRNAINAKLIQLGTEEEEDVETFDEFLLAEYGGSVDELIEFTLRPLKTFEDLKEELWIKTAQGKLVKPKVFPNRHLFLEVPARNSLEHLVASQTPKVLASTS